MGNKETGGGLALPIWIGYMQKVLKDLPTEERALPEGLIQGTGDLYYAENPPGAGVRSLGLAERPAPAEEATRDEVKNELF